MCCQNYKTDGETWEKYPLSESKALWNWWLIFPLPTTIWLDIQNKPAVWTYIGKFQAVLTQAKCQFSPNWVIRDNDQIREVDRKK